MVEIMKFLLWFDLIVFTLSFSLYSLTTKKGIGKILVVLGVISQLIYTIIVFNNRLPLISSWAFQSQILVLYMLIFNLLVLPIIQRKSLSWQFPISYNILFAFITLILFKSEFFNSIPPAINSYHLKYTLIFSGIVFSLLSFQLYLLLMEQHNLNKWKKKMNIMIPIFWGCSIISSMFWAKYAWGRYWSWDVIEIRSLIILFLLSFNYYLQSSSRDRIWKVLYLLIILSLIAFPILGSIYIGGGYAE